MTALVWVWVWPCSAWPLTVQGQDLYSGPGGFGQGQAEIPVLIPGRLKISHIAHLDNEHGIALVSLCQSPLKPVEVLDPSQGGGVGEADHPVFLQGDALHLRQAGPALVLKIEIEAGVAVAVLRLYKFRHEAQAALFKPLAEDGVGGGGVHVDEPAPLPDCHQVIGGLAPGIIGMLQKHPGSRHQQLPAPAGIFHMADQSFPIKLHMGDKAVGPGYEAGFRYVIIFHLGAYSSAQALAILEAAGSPGAFTSSSTVSPSLPRTARRLSVSWVNLSPRPKRRFMEAAFSAP